MTTLLERGLREEGYAVDVALNGTDGLWLATENVYDAIVLDVMLPGLDGLEVCRRLRSAQRWAPVLLLTARGAVDDRVEGLDAGADDYLTKPFSFAELAARLRRWSGEPPVPGRRSSRSATSASTPPRIARGAATSNSRCRRRRWRCSRCSCAIREKW